MRVLIAALLLSIPASAKPKEKELIQAFATGKAEERVRLAAALGRMGEKKAVEALINAFDIRQGGAKESAAIIDALGRSGDPRALEPLLGAWDYMRSLSLQMGELPGQLQAARYKLLEALGRLGGDPAVAVLSEALNDKDTRAVEEAVRSLGRLQVKDSVPALLQLAGSGGNLTQAVFESLGEIKDKRAVSVLEQALASPDKLLEVQAAYALARYGRKDALERLQANLKNDPGAEKVGLLAGYYLAKLDRASGLEHLERLMRRKDSPYAALAADALGKTENPRAALALIEGAKSDESGVRLMIARSLGRLGGKRAVSALQKLADDPNPSVRMAAKAALVDLGELD